jgi:hypothetical protein
MPLHDFVNTLRPPRTRPPTTKNFEAEWLFFDRAQIWYRDIGTPQAFTRHLQQVSCFCKKSELYSIMHGLRDTGNTADSTLPMSTGFWKAHKLDTDLEAILKAGTLQIDLHSNDAVTVWSNRIHYIDFILLYKITSLWLLWSNEPAHNIKSRTSYPIPAQKVADDLVKTNVLRQLVSISRILDALCCQRLSLLVHNMNSHILENLSSIALSIDSVASGNTHRAAFYSRLGSALNDSIRRYKEPISMQGTTITAELDLEFAPADIIQYVRSQGLSPSEVSTASPPGLSAPVTPSNIDPYNLEHIAIQHMEKDCMKEGLNTTLDLSEFVHATNHSE